MMGDMRPNQHLLRLHSAVAKVLHLTGMSEEIEEILRDRESISCVASDGSTDLVHAGDPKYWCIITPKCQEAYVFVK